MFPTVAQLLVKLSEILHLSMISCNYKLPFLCSENYEYNAVIWYLGNLNSNGVNKNSSEGFFHLSVDYS